jgi:hypothetical protein
MPPRYAYWTILVDDAPTAFRSGSKEELLPTFNRLKEKHASAVMMWWQNGKLWPSRIDAQEAMRARGEIGRRNDTRQSWKPRSDERPKSFGDRKPQAASRKPFDRPEWTPKPQAPSPKSPEWTPKPQAAGRKPQAAGRKPFDRPDWTPKSQAPSPKSRDWTPKPQAASRKPRLDWTPKSGYTDKADRPATEKRQWIPKTEYKKSLGIEPKKDSKWRPGGEHRDPKQKYKDAKKAKWTQFKQNIRKRWEAKGGKKEK